MNWNSLRFGIYSKQTVQDAVNDNAWQSFRVSLLGASLQTKYNRLHTYMKLHNYSERAKIQVTNYVNALARGGLILPW